MYLKKFGLLILVVVLVSSFAYVGAAEKYKEAPMLAELVQAGKLPPVEERLPENPLVFDVEKIGQYGGTIRTFQFGHPDRWHISKSTMRQYLFGVPPTMEAFSEKGIMEAMEPNIAERGEWNPDATELTIYLRKGIKWSDGHPFTADDILFAWDDMEFNPDFKPRPESRLLVKGEAPKLEKIDDFTLKWTFPSPAPTYIAIAFHGRTLITPKHYLKDFHPRYNPNATYKELNEIKDFWNPERPTMTAWKMVKYDTTQEAIVERNPYYWGVDQEGNQLPYIDRVIYKMLPNQEAAILQGVSGQLDYACRNFQLLESYPMLRENEEKGNYRIVLTSGQNWTVGTEIWLPYDLQDPDYPELREMFRKAPFRKALSIALDRAYINESLFLGLGVPASITISEKAPEWDEELEELTKINAYYDPDEAKSLLGELGLKDQNGDGIREYPNGKNVVLILDAAAEMTSYVKNGELYVKFWRDIGIDARLNVESRQVVLSKMRSGNSHGTIWGTAAQLWLWGKTAEGALVPGFQTPSQLASGVIKDAPDDLVETWTLFDDFLAAKNPEESRQTVKTIARHRVDNTIGIFTLRDVPIMILLNKKIANFPEGFVFVEGGMPWARMMTWFYEN